jgi:hypothetical protein
MCQLPDQRHEMSDSQRACRSGRDKSAADSAGLRFTSF